MVAASEAKILSHVSNETMTAYLLSESSLFVYDHYLVMITCGTTQLVNAVSELMNHFTPQDIDAFFYERKNEIFPHNQHSSFFDDVNQLKTWFPGDALRFGREDEHHLYLYSTKNEYLPVATDHTMEILMYGISPQQLQRFKHNPSQDNQLLRKQSGIAGLVRGKVDDHVFSPMGYSLNAIDGPFYYTIHVTPENVGNYTSFETNAIPVKDQANFAKQVLEVFQPESFDLMLFNPKTIDRPDFPNFQLKRFYQDQLASGYSTQYLCYDKPQDQWHKPHRFEDTP